MDEDREDSETFLWWWGDKGGEEGDSNENFSWQNQRFPDFTLHGVQTLNSPLNLPFISAAFHYGFCFFKLHNRIMNQNKASLQCVGKSSASMKQLDIEHRVWVWWCWGKRKHVV